MKKTYACHISIERGEVKKSGVSGQILMVWATKMIFLIVKKYKILRSKDLKSSVQ